MSEDELHIQTKTHLAGMLLAANSLIRKLDRPGMTIDYLRESREVELFRRQTDDFANWFLASLASAPDEICPPEERRFISRWIAERQKM